MPHGYCFRWAAQWQLSQRSRKNTATVLRAVAKSHNRLKGAVVFGYRYSGRNLERFSKVAGKSPYWGLFIVKLQPVMA